VNDELAIESTDAVFSSGAVGLAKFRDTSAEFKGFAVGEKISDAKASPELAAQIAKLVAEIPVDRPPGRELVEKIDSQTKEGVTVLRERAKTLSRQAERLEQLAVQLHQNQTRRAIAELLNKKDDEIDLLHATLLISQIDNEELDVDVYLRQVDRMITEVQSMYAKEADENVRLAALNKYLFDELGFHGSRTNYYSSSNSYLNEVIDDREGLPITLSVLYMELSRRIGVKVVGVGLPGHFIVRHEPAKGEPVYLDPYDRAKAYRRDELEGIVRERSGQPLEESHLATQSKKQILQRMLTNLSRVAQERRDSEGMLRYAEASLVIDPESAQQHWFRAVLRFQTQRIDEAIEDAEWLLAREPADIDMPLVRQLRATLEESKARSD
jgi:regulator of sirC expression with transglutaminase-like and TPR domain